MKLLIGVLLLLVTFVAAAMWQRSWRAEAEAERDLARSGEQRTPAGPSGSHTGEWGRVIVGRPSGADPAPPMYDPLGSESSTSSIPGPTAARSDSPRTAVSETLRTVAPSTDEPKITVQKGESLSSLCQAHYGTSRQELVQALAHYNNLKDPNGLREGQTLTLPPIERLISKDH